MEDAAVVCGDYITFKHVKTRKVVILEIEIPEERFQDVISRLGMPIGGESKPVAVALLDVQMSNNVRSLVNSSLQQEKTEGEKLRIKSVMLCRDKMFQKYVADLRDTIDALEGDARDLIIRGCGIGSRSELAINKDAQAAFKDLLARYDAWLIEQQYSDNLERL